MNETLRNRPPGAALPGQTQDDQSIPILTERLTLPPLDLDTTLPAFAAPVSLQLPPAPVEPADAISVEEISLTTVPSEFAADVGTAAVAPATDDAASMAAQTAQAELERPPPTSAAARSEALRAMDYVPFHDTMPETSGELQDGDNFAVQLEFSPASLPRSLPASAPAAPYRAAPISDYSPGHSTALSAAYSAPAPTVTAQAAPPPDTGAHWTRIEIELRESILAGLTRQLPLDVERIVREQIEPAFTDIVNRLAIEARMAIAASLREIVGRAVKAELDALRARRR